MCQRHRANKSEVVLQRVRVLPPRLAPVLRLALALVLESPSPALAVAFPARPHSATRTSRS